MIYPSTDITTFVLIRISTSPKPIGRSPGCLSSGTNLQAKKAWSDFLSHVCDLCRLLHIPMKLNAISNHPSVQAWWFRTTFRYLCSLLQHSWFIDGVIHDWVENWNRSLQYSLHSLLFPQDVFVLQDSGFCHSQRMNASAHMICHNTNGCIHILFLHLCFEIFWKVSDISDRYRY